MPAAGLRTLAAPAIQQSAVVAKIEGMPGACPPLGFFDPLGFSKDASPETMKKCAAALLPLAPTLPAIDRLRLRRALATDTADSPP